MRCPVDGATLIVTERRGVEIDYCPDCRGVWLDRGELDKIIEASTQQPPPAPRMGQREARQGYAQPQARPGEYRPGGDRRKKKGLGSLIEDIFDF
jgi:Zn-finger nucleic acid-binding protein